LTLPPSEYTLRKVMASIGIKVELRVDSQRALG
jgi:hypothetical protein